MRRRTFIAAVGGGVLASVARLRAAENGAVHRIGYLSLGSPAAEATRFNALRAGLATLGYVEGKNLVIEARWLDGGKYETLPDLAVQLLALKVDVIVTYATPGVQAAQSVTKTVPIVFTSLGDAVAVGVAASLAHPGGNATGNTYFIPELAAKRLELLKEAIPSLDGAGVLFNAGNRSTAPVLKSLQVAAQSLDIELMQFAVAEPADLADAFAAMAKKSLRAFVISEDPMLIYNIETCARLALQYRLASSGFPESALAGGFVAYGIDFLELWRHAASFVDKILKGTAVADLPVEQATKFVTVVNKKTAAAIGIEVPTSLLLRADQVIE